MQRIFVVAREKVLKGLAFLAFLSQNEKLNYLWDIQCTCRGPRSWAKKESLGRAAAVSKVQSWIRDN